MAKYRNGRFFQLPKGIHRIVDDPYQLAILTFLLQCEKDGQAFPSYQTMTQGLMSRWQAIESIKKLKDKGFLVKESNNFRSNIYHLNIPKLVSEAYQYATQTSKPHLPTSKPHLPPLVSHTYPNNNKRTIITNNMAGENKNGKFNENRGNHKWSGTKLPDRFGYTEPPRDPELEKLAAQL